jgi:hypothetical protein
VNKVSTICVWGVYPLGACGFKELQLFYFEIMKDIGHERHGFMI